MRKRQNKRESDGPGAAKINMTVNEFREFMNKAPLPFSRSGSIGRRLQGTWGDIMLKMLELPDAEKIEESLDEAQKWASSVGYKEEDVNDIIKSVRQSKQNESGC